MMGRILKGAVIAALGFVASLPSMVLVFHWLGRDDLSTSAGLLFFQIISLGTV